MPTSSPSKPRCPGGCLQQAPGGAIEADSPFAAGGQHLLQSNSVSQVAAAGASEPAAHSEGGRRAAATANPACRTASDSEKRRLRDQLKAFIVDAADTVPVSFVDVASGKMQLGSYTLDPGLTTVCFEIGSTRSCMPVQNVVDTFRPEDCLAWEQAGHRWPITRLRRLVLISVLEPDGDCLRAWLEADEARRDRCLVSLSILASPPAGDPETAGLALLTHPHIDLGTLDAEAGAISASRSAAGTTCNDFLPKAVLLTQQVEAASVKREPLSTGSGGGAVAVSAAFAPAAVAEASGKAERSTEESRTTAKPCPPVPAHHVNTAEELRCLTKQFARDAAIGVEGIYLVDLITGARTGCHYRLDPERGQLVFAIGPPPPKDAEEVIDVFSPDGHNATASTTASTRRGGVESSMDSTASRGGGCGAGIAAPESADLTSEGPEAAVSAAQAEPGSCPSTGAGAFYEAETGAADEALLRLSWSAVQEIWRPEHRSRFASGHPWYAALLMVERERLVCLDYSGTSGGNCGGNAFCGVVCSAAGAAATTACTSAAASSAEATPVAPASRDDVGQLAFPLQDQEAQALRTLCIMERDRVARERFVVCAKVLRLSMAVSLQQ